MRHSNFLILRKTRWQVNLLFQDLPLNPKAFTVPTSYFWDTTSPITLRTPFFDSIVSDHRATTSTLEAFARLRVFSCFGATTAVTNDSLIQIDLNRCTVNRLLKIYLSIMPNISSSSVIPCHTRVISLKVKEVIELIPSLLLEVLALISFFPKLLCFLSIFPFWLLTWFSSFIT